jgi:hypothetical protein
LVFLADERSAAVFDFFPDLFTDFLAVFFIFAAFAIVFPAVLTDRGIRLETKTRQSIP